MKLFKKLAAAVLAAVLALSMVGCGKANSVNATKQLVLDLIADSADQNDAEINNTAAMDGIAQNLLNKAAELYGSEGYAGKPVVTLLDAASKTAISMQIFMVKPFLILFINPVSHPSYCTNQIYSQLFADILNMCIHNSLFPIIIFSPYHI